MLRRVAHLITAAWLISAALRTVDGPFIARGCVATDVLTTAAPSATGPPPVSGGEAQGAVPYQELIRSVSEQHGVPADLVTSVIRLESNFNPAAVSPRGARGLMQLMPDTAAELGVHNSFDVEQNLEGGVRYLRALLERFAGDVALAVAAYNAGAEVVKRYGGIPPYPETERYVERFLHIYRGTDARWVSQPATGEVGPARAGPPSAEADLMVMAWSEFGCPSGGQTIGRWHDWTIGSRHDWS
jgi:soluble lytic murein transglycosylase-like protein